MAFPLAEQICDVNVRFSWLRCTGSLVRMRIESGDIERSAKYSAKYSATQQLVILLAPCLKRLSSTNLLYASLILLLLNGEPTYNVKYHRAGYITEPATFFYTKKSTFLALLSQAPLNKIL